MIRRKGALATLSGQRWRATHQSTVDAVLGAGVRKVRSTGSQFFNMDNWTARSFGADLCEWARLNPGKTPDRYDVEGWLSDANRNRVSHSDRGITIASTPDELPIGLAMALVGGGYHEAWHTEFSRNTPLHMREVWPKILDLWKLVPYEPSKGKKGWSGLTGPLLQWSNIIEDIRIERVGCKKYPGAHSKMEALQDLILAQEAESRAKALEMRGATLNDDLSTVMGAYRDLGLGYTTPPQKLAITEYQKRSPEGWAFVTKGSLKPFLDRAINLGVRDDMESLWLAMEVVAAISEASTPQPKPPKPPPQPKGDPPKDAPPSNSETSDDEDEGEAGSGPPPKATTFKVGDRAILKAGPYKGRTVEVTRAGLADRTTGHQDLEYALVEDE